jgi:hypothetical protein
MSRAEPLTLGIAEGHAAFAFQPVERGIVGEVIAVVVGDRKRDAAGRLIAEVNRRLRVLDRQRHVAADEADAGIAQQRAGQQAASVSTWKPLHTPSTGTPAARRRDHRRMIGERAAIAPQRR